MGVVFEKKILLFLSLVLTCFSLSNCAQISQWKKDYAEYKQHWLKENCNVRSAEKGGESDGARTDLSSQASDPFSFSDYKDCPNHRELQSIYNHEWWKSVEEKERAARKHEAMDRLGKDHGTALAGDLLTLFTK